MNDLGFATTQAETKGTLVEVGEARATAEVQAAFVIAKKFPRSQKGKVKMNFQEALALMQKGAKVRRDAWLDVSYIYLNASYFKDQDSDSYYLTSEDCRASDWIEEKEEALSIYVEKLEDIEDQFDALVIKFSDHWEKIALFEKELNKNWKTIGSINETIALLQADNKKLWAKLGFTANDLNLYKTECNGTLKYLKEMIRKLDLRFPPEKLEKKETENE